MKLNMFIPYQLYGPKFKLFWKFQQIMVKLPKNIAYGRPLNKPKCANIKGYKKYMYIINIVFVVVVFSVVVFSMVVFGGLSLPWSSLPWLSLPWLSLPWLSSSFKLWVKVGLPNIWSYYNKANLLVTRWRAHTFKRKENIV